MRSLGPLAVSLALAASGDAHARRIYRPPPPIVDVGAELGAAIRAKDTAGVAKLLFDPLHNYGVYFADPACAKQFGAPGIVVGPELSAFARCLVGLKLQASTRQPGATTNGIVTYEPGIELELSHTDGRVRWIGFQYQTEHDRGRPTLTVQAFEALRKAGSPNVDAVVRERLEPLLERSRTASVSAWVKVCLDDKGGIERIATRHSSAPASDTGAVTAAFEAAVRTWKFQPFQQRGKPLAVCAMTLLTYPMARAPLVETLPAAMQPPITLARRDGAPPKPAPPRSPISLSLDDDEVDEVSVILNGRSPPPPPRPPPPPPPPPQTVPPTMLEQQRLRGVKDIAPDAPTAAAIARSGKDRIVGSYKLCLDTGGSVSSVVMLKSTGFTDYDMKLAREIRIWAYKPYMVNGKAVPVCTAATFIYSVPPARKP
jgi:hypothetical protein